MDEMPRKRIAMWSGPRNISTAMMRAFGNRADTVAVDEPFYAAYLAATGIDHPMRDQVLAAQPSDPAEAVRRMMGPLPPGARVQYQKHMTHHLTSAVPRGWFGRVRHAFLIRRPEDVLASYAAKREAVTAADIGFREQAEIFLDLAAAGREAPVVDARDVLADPQGVLSALCAALGLSFEPSMLTWAPGPRPEDGPWGAHWYAAVWRSTGFAPPRPPVARAELPLPLQAIAAEVEPHYRLLREHALRPRVAGAVAFP